MLMSAYHVAFGLVTGVLAGTREWCVDASDRHRP